MRKTACKTGFASGGVTCKLEVLCLYSSSVLVDSFVLRNLPEHKARNRYLSVQKPAAHSSTFGLLPTRIAQTKKPKELEFFPTHGRQK